MALSLQQPMPSICKQQSCSFNKLSEPATHHWIEYVFLIPEVVGHVTSNEVMFRYKGKEPTTSQRVPVTVTGKKVLIINRKPNMIGLTELMVIPGVSGRYPQVFHAFPHLHVLCTAPVTPTQHSFLVAQSLGGESLESFFGENVARATAHVSLLHIRLELATKVHRLRVVVGLQHVAQVLHHHIGVVIRLQEPVSITQVVFVEVAVSLFGLCPQTVSALPHIEPDSREIGVLLGRHEDEFVAAPPPGGLDMLGAGLVVLWPRHHPAKDADRAGQRAGGGRGGGEGGGVELFVLRVQHQIGMRSRSRITKCLQ